MIDRQLVVSVAVNCYNCKASGMWHDGSTCEHCDGHGWVEAHARPTPADLLTDPRVRALVEAVRHSSLGDLSAEAWRDDLIAALAPFEVSDVR